MREFFDKGYVKTALHQLIGKFNANKASTNNSNVFYGAQLFFISSR